MIDAASVSAVIDLYSRHGWTPRIALALKPDALRLLFPDDLPVRQSQFEAIWFSRRSSTGSETWELRSMSTPFALVAFLDDGDDELERETILSETESKMASHLERIPRSH